MRLISLLRLLVIVLLAMPVLMVLAAWLQWNDASADILLGMASTVLPSYVVSSLGLCFWVAIGVISMGSVSAAAVTLFDFKGRRSMEWALLLPLAMPAYVVAYAYSDFLQFSGPLQTGLRAWLGWQGPLWPDVRSLWGAAAVLSFALYPYVYLLVRAALVERAPQLMEAARLLGADLPRRIFRVALPLARPAIAAGTALALMETLADFGVSSYFGVTTFSTGIYKAWLVMDDRVAAAQLATFLLVLVALMLRRAKSPSPLALCQSAQHGTRRRVTAFATQRVASGFGFAAVCHARAAGLCLAFADHGPRTVGSQPKRVDRLAEVFSLDGQQPLPWFVDRCAGGWLGAVIGLQSARSWWCLAALEHTGGWFGLCRSRRHHRGWLVAADWLVAAGMAPKPSRLLVDRHHLGLGVGLPCSFYCSGAASGANRLHPHSSEHRRGFAHLGVFRTALFTRVHWPLLKRSTAAALLLVLVDVMKELPATLVLRPFNTDTLAVMAYQLARDERLGRRPCRRWRWCWWVCYPSCF